MMAGLFAEAGEDVVLFYQPIINIHSVLIAEAGAFGETAPQIFVYFLAKAEPQVWTGSLYGAPLLGAGSMLRTSLLGTPALLLGGLANILPRKQWTFAARTFA